MYTNFYQDQEMKYSEIAIVLEDFKCGEKGKFYIPVLLPEVGSGRPISKSGKVSTSNILNPSGKSGIGSYNTGNYVELRVPSYIEQEVEVTKYINGIYTDVIEKGTKLLVTFIGGEANRPVIIGMIP